MVTVSPHLWLALVIGNTRLHWAAFVGEQWLGCWHTRHLHRAEAVVLMQQGFRSTSWVTLTHDLVPAILSHSHTHNSAFTADVPLYVASVVPAQLDLWQPYPALQILGLDAVPLQGLYSTLGIDRALNLLGAGDRYGWPVIVVDAGTALTFTAGAEGHFIGGAILPGLALQFKALGEHAADLPKIPMAEARPSRWARTTPEAIRSGILYGVTAATESFLTDWYRCYPSTALVMTGGDAPSLLQEVALPPPAPAIHHDPHVVFWGMARCYGQQRTPG